MIKVINNNQPSEVKIPIREIVETAVRKYDDDYAEEFILLMRRYFIACLNLGYLCPDELEETVEKFCSRIRNVYYAITDEDGTLFCEFEDDSLFINEPINFKLLKKFEVNCFKAIFAVISDTSKYTRHFPLKKAIATIVGEKIWVMDVHGSRIVMPKTEAIQIGNKEFHLRTGYCTDNLLITLVKQFFISQDINENLIIKDSHHIGFDDAVKSYIRTDEQSEALLSMLDTISYSHENGLVSKELLLLKIYQSMINKEFTTHDNNYVAFLALVLDDELRNRFVKESGINL